MATRDPFNLELISDEHFIGVGRVAVSWSFLEGSLERIIWRTLRLNDRRGIAVTTHLSLPMRLDMMRTVVHEEFSDDPIVEDVGKIAHHIRHCLAPKRNGIVHNRIIQFANSNAIRTTYKARGKVIKEWEPIDPGEYEETVSKILDTTNGLLKIISRIYDLVEAKDGAPPP